MSLKIYMTPSENSDKETETEKLTQMLSMLQNLYYKKKDQLAELQTEISEIHSILNYLNSIITTKSFSTADKMYPDLVPSNNIAVEDYFKEDISEEKFKGTNIKRKIFSDKKQKEEDLLCILNLYDFKKVEIKFMNPEIRAIKETSENFINLFLRGALIKIKESNPNLSVSYSFFKNTDKIEYIHISNLHSIKDYDLITEKIRELLAYEKS
ncbi:MAG: hypothetical protein EU531_06425 [Promethearchaeota archaeon]|nr:MAG: hypothetical protein EU531_06425 [Candidatus Lokiarchaeota archaeon]